MTRAPLLLLLVTSLLAQAPDTVQKKLATISGRTAGAGGQPLRKCLLTLKPLGGPSSAPYGVESDLRGNYSFDGVEPGTYLLTAEHPGYLRTSYGSKGVGGNSGVMVTLAPEQALKGLDIELVRQSALVGRVFDDDGDPVPGVRVSALRRGFSLMGNIQFTFASPEAVTDENGAYRIPNLTPGKYLVKVVPNLMMPGETMRRPAGDRTKTDAPSFVTTYYPASTDIAAAAIATLSPGQDASGVDVKIVKRSLFHIKGRAGSLKGTILFVPVDGTGGSSEWRQIAIAPNGAFDLPKTTPRRYKLFLQFAQSAQLLSPHEIEVSNRDIEDLSLDAVPPSDLTGVAMLEDKTPVADCHVQLITTENIAFNLGIANTAKDGAFVLPKVNPGKYLVSVSGLAGNSYVKSVKFGRGQPIDSGLDLTPGATGPIEIAIASDGAEITGAVNDKDGKPVPGGAVILIPEPIAGIRHPDRFRNAGADQTGQFRFRAIAPGNYRIYALAEIENSAQYDPEFTRLHESEAQKLTIEANGKTQITLTR